MNHEKAITTLFNHFYNKIYKNSNYKLDLTINNQSKMVSNFLMRLQKYYGNLESIGVNFWARYFSFAFSIYADQNLKRKISLNWIIGPKTFQKFLEQKEGHQYYVTKFLTEYDINLEDVKADIAEEQMIEDKLDPCEEREKLRHTGDARLYHCLMNTTLYNHRSVNCIACENKLTCKRILQDKYPRLYRKRGYIK